MYRQMNNSPASQEAGPFDGNYGITAEENEQQQAEEEKQDGV